jgi:hypothetical protein
MIKGVQNSETLVNLYQSTRRYKPEDSHLAIYRLENLKFYLFYFFSVAVPFYPEL